MAQVITAPSIELPIYDSVFLAGGITNCKEWQLEVIKYLESTDDISIFNPRQKNFDKSLSGDSQIFWEYERLEQMDIFSMYFCNDNSDQPICMYELGRNIVRMQDRFPDDWKDRIIVSVEDGYRRKNDVIIQLKICAPNLFVDPNGCTEAHASNIIKAHKKLVRDNAILRNYSGAHRYEFN